VLEHGTGMEAAWRFRTPLAKGMAICAPPKGGKEKVLWGGVRGDGDLWFSLPEACLQAASPESAGRRDSLAPLSPAESVKALCPTPVSHRRMGEIPGRERIRS